MASASDEPMVPADGEYLNLLPHAPDAQGHISHMVAGASIGRYRMKPW